MTDVDLYAAPTVNGQKAAIMLEEVGAHYDLHAVDLDRGEHRRPAHLAVNPFGRLPAIVDRGRDGLLIYGTLAICHYLAEKHDKLMPDDAHGRAYAHQWAAFAATDLAPAFAGRLLFTTLAPEPMPWATEAYEKEARRMLGILDGRLAEAPFLAGETYTVADVLAYPCAATSAELLPEGLNGFDHLRAWCRQISTRPAVTRAMELTRTIN